jgi:glycosyltransferase involved in cell wall biosynthesis
VELLSAPTADPAAFAAQLVRLYTHEPLWQSLRAAALARLAAENSFARYQTQLAAILSSVSP